MKMSAKKLIMVTVSAIAMFMFAGCESGGSSSGGSGNLGGTWTGTTAGRPLSIYLEQDGTSLSGSYTLSNPTFTEGLSGTASSATAPATATLTGGADRRFEISFDSASSMSGGFFKGSSQVGSVSASK
jgi:hypothetical protein